MISPSGVTEGLGPQTPERRELDVLYDGSVHFFAGEAHPVVECKYLAFPWYKMKITQYDRNTCVATQVTARLAPCTRDVNTVITYNTLQIWLLLDNDSWLKMN